MQNSESIKNIVKEKYSEVVNKNAGGTSCGCGTTCCTDFSESYETLEGYVKEADYGLGCGIPTETAKIKEGDTVIDLGSGAGNDCFVARSIVGENGKVIGIDFTDAMVSKARDNAKKLRLENVDFLKGDIEDMPLKNNMADVIVSNCVLNLVPDKNKAFSEIYRVLKPGGHFSISDVVTIGNLPEGLKVDAEMYAGCVSGAIQKEEYLEIIKRSGFINVEIVKEKKINLPEEVLATYMESEEVNSFLNQKRGIFSITVYAEKPSNVIETACCGPNCCN